MSLALQDFQKCYPWQEKIWQQLVQSFPNYAHAMLFSGRQGTGKKDFVWRFLVWLLCEQKNQGGNATQHACGECASCNWFKAGTHPNFLHVTVAADSKSDTIKVDDVRAILPFAQQSSQGMRVIFIQDAHLMNVSAANALLKTLEEPAANVLILLTSDHPQLLLPTIKSRVQQLDVSHVSEAVASDFLAKHVANAAPSFEAQYGSPLPSIEQLLAMTGGAPLQVNELIESAWLPHRNTWLKVWQALRVGQRSSVAASNFWKKQFEIEDAIKLQRIMCNDVLALINDLPTLQQDIDFSVLKPLPKVQDIVQVANMLNGFMVEKKQNVQSIYLFEKLMQSLSVC